MLGFSIKSDHYNSHEHIVTTHYPFPSCAILPPTVSPENHPTALLLLTSMNPFRFSSLSLKEGRYIYSKSFPLYPQRCLIHDRLIVLSTLVLSIL